MKKISLYISFIIAVLISVFAVSGVYAVDTEVESDVTVDLAVDADAIDTISDDELTQAEPGELPEEVVDEELTAELEGEMLLDVEGNGEVYYVDPVDGGKEYLADGKAAHALLERRALGISEENFAKLDQGEQKDEESVCGENELATRLRGRIVLRVEMNGEAWWVFPRNCRAYYVGTHDAAYQLMRRFSLGILKKNLARIPDTARQRVKTSFRLHVYAYAEINDVSLEEAKEAVKDRAITLRECLIEAKVSFRQDRDRTVLRSQIQACREEVGLPGIDRDKREELIDIIKEARRAHLETKAKLGELRVDELKTRLRARQSTDVDVNL